MAGDRPQSPDLRVNGHHEHAWRCLEDGDSSGSWAFECTICHRTRAGLRVGRNGKVESASDVASVQQQASADDRERALDVRESTLRAQELRQVERADEVEQVLLKAARRDEVADARDEAAAKRDMTADSTVDRRRPHHLRHAWPHMGQSLPDAEARQEALDDRLHSRSDRKASAVDRAVLADGPSCGGRDTDDR